MEIPQLNGFPNDQTYLRCPAGAGADYLSGGGRKVTNTMGSCKAHAFEEVTDGKLTGTVDNGGIPRLLQ